MAWPELTCCAAFLLVLTAEAGAQPRSLPAEQAMARRAPGLERRGALPDPAANRLGQWSNPLANRGPGYPPSVLAAGRPTTAPCRAGAAQACPARSNERMAAASNGVGEEDAAGWHLDLRPANGGQQPCPAGTRPQPLDQPMIGFRCVPR